MGAIARIAGKIGRYAGKALQFIGAGTVAIQAKETVEKVETVVNPTGSESGRNLFHTALLLLAGVVVLKLFFGRR